MVGLGQVSLAFSTGNYCYVLSFNCTWSTAAGIALYGRASLVQSCAITGVTIASFVFNPSLLIGLGAGAGAGEPLNPLLNNPGIVANLINPDGSVNTANLTPAGDAVTTSHGYDTLYRLVSDTLSGNGQSCSIQRLYDANGRLARMTDPTGSQFSMTYSPQGYATELVLDPAIPAIGVNWWSLARAAVNAAGQKLAWSNLACQWCSLPVPPSTSYTYDPVSGVPTSTTDGLGNTVNYLWYPTGALAARYSQAGAGWYLWSALTYDLHGAILTNQCGPIATRPSLTNLTPQAADAACSYVYDANGRLTSKTVQYAGQAPKTTSYSDDAWGNNTGFVNPWGQRVSITLDAYGRKSSLSATAEANGASYTAQQVTHTYDAIGRPASVARAYFDGLGDSAVSTLTYSYDALLRTTGLSESLTVQGQEGVQAKTGVITGFTQSLSYDFWDNIVGNAIQITYHDQTPDSLSQSYGFDTWERLVSYSVAPGATLAPLGADGTPIASQGFAYDQFNNLLTATSTSPTGATATVTSTVNDDNPFMIETVSPGAGGGRPPHHRLRRPAAGDPGRARYGDHLRCPGAGGLHDPGGRADAELPVRARRGDRLRARERRRGPLQLPRRGQSGRAGGRRRGGASAHPDGLRHRGLSHHARPARQSHPHPHPVDSAGFLGPADG